jgi:outer membrane protein OmpA-like peptidoglycan-associated protein
MARYSTFLPLLLLCSCAPTPGPDKAISGALLGAGWGAGSGAIVGNQLNTTGPGIAVGAGLGAAAGALTGIGFDIEEGHHLQTRRELNHLKARVALNERELQALQDQFNGRGRMLTHLPSGLTIYFDPGLAALRAGSAKELERLAQSLKLDPQLRRVEIYGHSDDTGSKDQNEELAKARARAVESLLVAHGLSADQLKSVGMSSSEPKATNQSEVGRQLNRRVEIVVVR